MWDNANFHVPAVFNQCHITAAWDWTELTSSMVHLVSWSTAVQAMSIEPQPVPHCHSVLQEVQDTCREPTHLVFWLNDSMNTAHRLWRLCPCNGNIWIYRSLLLKFGPLQSPWQKNWTMVLTFAHCFRLDWLCLFQQARLSPSILGHASHAHALDLELFSPLWMLFWRLCLVTLQQLQHPVAAVDPFALQNSCWK